MPIIPIPGGARGYSFLYTHSGGASDDFVIALPKTMPNVNFLATVQPASGPGDFVSCKVIQPDNTTTQIHVVTASPIADGTQLIVTVNGVASRVMPVVVDGITIVGAGITGDPLVSLVTPAPVPKSYVFGAGDAWFYSVAGQELLTSDVITVAAGRRIIVDGWAALWLTGNLTPKTIELRIHLYMDFGVKAQIRLATCSEVIVYDPTSPVALSATLAGFGSFISDGNPHDYAIVVEFAGGDVDTDVFAVVGVLNGAWTRGLRITDTAAV